MVRGGEGEPRRLRAAPFHEARNDFGVCGLYARGRGRREFPNELGGTS